MTAQSMLVKVVPAARALYYLRHTYLPVLCQCAG